MNNDDNNSGVTRRDVLQSLALAMSVPSLLTSAPSAAQTTSPADTSSAASAIAAEVQKYGWQNIKSLVYAVPTYDCARIAQTPDRLKTNSPTQNLSRNFLRGFRDSMAGLDGTKVSRSNLVQMFFATLAATLIKE